MSTITKQAVQAVADLKAGYTLGHADVAILNELARIALASLEAEAVGYVDAEYAELLRSGHIESCSVYAEPGEGCCPAYTAPPEPVSVHEDEQYKPHPVMAVKGELGFLDHFDRIIGERDEDIDIGQLGSSNYEALLLAALDAFRAAMLQGADGTLTNEGTIPVTQFKPVADLYGLTSPTGCETSFTFDAVEARDFIDGGWLCQEYVELERFQEAITNHTEDKLAMVDHSGDSNNMVEPVTTAYKLPDDFDFDRFNDVVWLEAVASNPHMHSLTTSTIAMVALELNRKLADCNSPVIPDGWVACRERLPPEGYEPDGGAVCYLVWHKNEVDCGPQYSISNVFFLRKHWEKNFTHWMPLPAAPQQEVKNG